MITTLTELLTELARLEDTKVYVENRILKVQTALAEIEVLAVRREESSDRPKAHESAPEPLPEPHNGARRIRVNVSRLVRETIDTLSPDEVFDHGTLWTKMLAQCPEIDGLKNRLYPALAMEQKQGKVKRAPGGYQRSYERSVIT